MKDNFNLHSWKYNQLMEEVRDEIQSQIDGIIPLISKIDLLILILVDYIKFKYMMKVVMN